jgi:hypothetical protein
MTSVQNRQLPLNGNKIPLKKGISKYLENNNKDFRWSLP